VPGSVAGLVYAQQHWGKLPLRTVMQPAIRLAREGVRLTWEEAQSMHQPELAQFPDSKRIFQRNGTLYVPGETFRQPELARTLERIAANPQDFYKGALARELAAEIQRGGGLITAEDMAAYDVKERSPVKGTYRGYEIFAAPPPSSGGITMLETLNILEGYDLGKLGNRSADSIHLTVEAFRRAFFDRAELLGDPDFSQAGRGHHRMGADDAVPARRARRSGHAAGDRRRGKHGCSGQDGVRFRKAGRGGSGGGVEDPTLSAKNAE